MQRLRGRAYRPKTRDSHHGGPLAPNLLAAVQGHLDRADQVWVSDITYLPTREGWLYVASVMDLFSRRIVGWACSTSLKSDFVNLALACALGDRRPPPGLISYSDRGVQYASQSHRQLLGKHGILQSMTRKGHCNDNAAKEAFFSLQIA